MPLTKARFKISQYSENRKHKLQGREHKIRQVSLALTSMVDMFAILVIFLLTNTSTVEQWLQLEHDIELPKAKFSEAPPKGITLQVSQQNLYIDNKPVLNISQIQHGSLFIGPLKSWLTAQERKGDYVNLVGHEKVPFGVVRRIIATCQEAGYSNVNLAVQPKGS